MKLIGLDPGLQRTGWGIINTDGNRLSYIGDGVVKTDPALSLAERLVQIHDGLVRVIETYRPDEAAVEETFVNRNPMSTLKLGQARGISLLVASRAGMVVGEYSPNLVKKSVVGAGHATKEQIAMMVRTLLPGCVIETEDAADALAVAICHAHHRTTDQRIARAMAGKGAGR